MKLIRKHARKIALMFSLSFLFVSCSQNEANETSSIKTDSGLYKRDGEKYSGEQIFRGLFFFQNDIADKIPQLSQIKSDMANNSNSNTITTSLNELSNISVEFIKNKYPNYFNELEEKIYSGNLYEISNELNYSSKLIEQSALSSDKYHSAFLFGKELQINENLQQQVSNLDLTTPNGIQTLNQLILDNTGTPENNIFGVTIFYVIAAVVSIAAVLYSVYVKVAYWDLKTSNVYNSDGVEVKIEREILINEIGTLFNPN